jgi:hypothetical protein
MAFERSAPAEPTDFVRHVQHACCNRLFAVERKIDAPPGQAHGRGETWRNRLFVEDRAAEIGECPRVGGRNDAHIEIGVRTRGVAGAHRAPTSPSSYAAEATRDEPVADRARTRERARLDREAHVAAKACEHRV